MYFYKIKTTKHMKKLLLFCIVVFLSNYLNSQIIITVNTAAKMQTVRGLGCQDDLESTGSTNDELLYDIGASSYRAFAGEGVEGGWNEPVNDNGDPKVLDLTKFPDITGASLLAYQKAARRGCVFYMTIGTPPAWQKSNNSCCNGGILLSTMYEEFGEFALGVTKKFKQQLGVDLYAINVQNEPEFVEPYYSCVYSGQQCVDASNAIVTKYKANGITTKIFFAEQCFTQKNVMAWAKLANNDATLSNEICAFANHTYNSDPYGGGMATINDWTTIYQEAKRVSPVKEVWMTEGGTTGKTVDDALGAAFEFYKAFKYGNATLFSHRYLGRSSTPINYYGIKSMVRYIRPGAYRLATTCSDTFSILDLAFKNDAKAAYTLYLVNRTTSDKTVKVNWTGATGKFEVFQTDEFTNCEWKGQVDLANNITLPARSITTLVSLTSNKIPNINPVDTVFIIKGATSKIVNLTGITDGGDGGQSLSIKAWSRDGSASLFSNISVNYTSPNTTGTITLIPTAGQLGNTKIMVALNDKSLALDSMFNEKVIAIPVYIIPYINKAPMMNDVSDQTYSKSQINTTQMLTLTGISDGNDGKQKLTLTATSSTPWIATVTTQGSTLVKITPKAEGTVTITLTLSDDGVNVGGGVGSITKTFTVIIGSGINAVEEFKNELQIYPIPAHDKITITNKDLKIQSYSIIDLTGKTILAGMINDEKVEINTSGLVPGIYLIRLISQEGSITNKIIIE
jgi:O-glycosyl hydrolase